MTEYTNADGTSIDVPDELASLLGPGWVTGDSGRVATPTNELNSSSAAAKPAGSSDTGPPPKGGKGSSDAAWISYARANRVKVNDDMTRREVIAACEGAGVPVE